MSSAVLTNLGNLHVVAGNITYDGSGVPTLSCNDESATIADTTTGVATVTFGDAFLAAPVVVGNYRKATEVATNINTLVIDSVSTTTAVFRFKADTNATNTTADPATGDGCWFLAIGKRNN